MSLETSMHRIFDIYACIAAHPRAQIASCQWIYSACPESRMETLLPSQVWHWRAWQRVSREALSTANKPRQRRGSRETSIARTSGDCSIRKSTSLSLDIVFVSGNCKFDSILATHLKARTNLHGEFVYIATDVASHVQIGTHRICTESWGATESIYASGLLRIRPTPAFAGGGRIHSYIRLALVRLYEFFDLTCPLP